MKYGQRKASGRGCIGGNGTPLEPPFQFGRARLPGGLSGPGGYPWGERPRPFAFAAASCCACTCGIDLERAAEASTREVVVINDGTNAMSVFCWPGDTLNGTLNGSLSIANGACGIFVKVDNGVTQDWRAGVIS